ncbi:MAG: protein kinase [Myxococcota bacterium]
MAEPSSCPSDDLLLQFATGVLGEAERARVARHIDACEECLEVLADADVNTLSDEGRADATVGVMPAGSVLGRYWVLERIGAGALGDVYAAYDPKLDRRVALKRFRQVSAVDARQTVAMVNEARALAKLAHPNVVQVFDVHTEGDPLFLTMELVPGTTLDQGCRASPRTWREVRDVFVGAGTGLAAAHDAGLVHRDFKPGNVLVTPEGRARVVDFGLARHSDGGSADADAAAGTPAYMAPEQWRGVAASGHADQFSFCVSLFEAVYGQHPFRRPGEPIDRKAVAAGDPITPRKAPLPGTPRWLLPVLVRGLAADPERRHADMPTLLRALQRDRRARRFGALALSIAIVVSAGSAFAVARATAPTLDLAAVEALQAEARAAAAAARFVYPPPSAPDAKTAYRLVLELEALEATTDEGPVYSSALRTELAGQLQQLGDEYWERPGGRGFAIDFYAAALLFDETATPAATRAVVTPGQLASLRGRATDGSFSPSELDAAQPLAALSLPDDEARVAALSNLLQGNDPPGHATTTQLDRLFDLEAPAPSKQRGATPVAEIAPAEAAPAEAVPAEAAPAVHVAAAPVEPTPPPPKPPQTLAAAEIAAARAASAKGQLAEAKRRYHRALSVAPKSTEALGGLARLHFNEGKYSKALEFAQRATKVAPRSATLHLLQGDAAFKLFRYAAATRAYARADELGSPLAAARLRKVERKIGAEP